MRVVIAGGGNVGLFVADELVRQGHDVLIVEQNREVAGRAQAHAHVEWQVADACEVSALRTAKLDTADVVVAATGDDEDNLVVSLLAKQEFAVPRVIARVNHPTNEWLFNETWGVDVSVSTPHLMTALVEEALTVGSLVRLLKLERGHVQLVEVRLADDSPAIGRTIAELEAPRDATFVAVVRGEHVLMPRGDTMFDVGDEVLALVTTESEEDVKRLLTGAGASPQPA